MTRGRLALTAAALLVGAASAAAVVALRAYEPLAPGSTGQPQLRGLASLVDPATGSGGKPVLFPELRAGRTYYVGFTLANRGRLDVTVEGLPTVDSSLIMLLRPVDLRTAPATASGSAYALVPLGRSVPLERLRVPSGEERSLWVGFRLDACEPNFVEGSSMSTDVVRLRYRYLGVFHRTADVEMPYAVTAQCGGELPPATR